jgi:hypothetical protein
MTTAILIVAAVALLGYDPAKALWTKYRNRKPADAIRDDAVFIDRDPTRIEAFEAAETLTAYFDSIGHASGIATSRAAAQWLFAESEE